MQDRLGTGHFNNSWRLIDSTEDPSFFVRFLDATRTRAYEFARNNPAAAFAHLELAADQTVLDVGCGTGDMLALIARQVGSGRAVGIEVSQVMVDEARKRHADVAANLEFAPMDARDLSFPDNEFDRVLATQLLVHVPEPERAFREMCRVVKPGGKVVLADIDWDGITLGCSNRELGRRFARLFCDGLQNGTVVHEYTGWFKEAGFTGMQILPQPILMNDWSMLRQWMVEPSLRQFVADKTFSEREAESLMHDLVERERLGKTFCGATLYTVLATKKA
ncbi:methyltransferase domain-containing protein [candidate division GN15 bacterium]|nr:methyltransferase domain-containing protein [candidate division GN15 bacterium]